MHDIMASASVESFEIAQMLIINEKCIFQVSASWLGQFQN